jgi:DNA-directed RNA polymerase subunit omega
MPGTRAPADIREGTAIATIDDLLSKVDSKYTLVHLAARRAREINSYYHSLGEGLGQYVRPLVDQVDSNKPLSIALEEIASEKIVCQYPGDARRAAEELFGVGGGEDLDEQRHAEVVSLGTVSSDPDEDVDPELAELVSEEPWEDLTASEPDAGPRGLELSPEELEDEELEPDTPSDTPSDTRGDWQS